MEKIKTIKIYPRRMI